MVLTGGFQWVHVPKQETGGQSLRAARIQPALTRSPFPLAGPASTEHSLSPFLNFSSGQVLQVCSYCPDEPERVVHLAIAVAPELIPYWRCDFATRSDGLG